MTYAEHMRQAAKDYLGKLMTKHRGNVRAIAIEAGLHRGYAYKKLHDLGLLAPSAQHGNEAWRSLQ